MASTHDELFGHTVNHDLVTLDVEVDQRFALVVVLNKNRWQLGPGAELDPRFHAIVERAHRADGGAAAEPVRQILRPLGVCLAQSFFGARLLKFDGGELGFLLGVGEPQGIDHVFRLSVWRLVQRRVLEVVMPQIGEYSQIGPNLLLLGFDEKMIFLLPHIDAPDVAGAEVDKLLALRELQVDLIAHIAAQLVNLVGVVGDDPYATIDLPWRRNPLGAGFGREVEHQGTSSEERRRTKQCADGSHGLSPCSMAGCEGSTTTSGSRR